MRALVIALSDTSLQLEGFLLWVGHSNFKKLFNHLFRSSKSLRLGERMISMAAILCVANLHTTEEHRMYSGDHAVNRNRQGTAPIIRMTDKVLQVLINTGMHSSIFNNLLLHVTTTASSGADQGIGHVR